MEKGVVYHHGSVPDIVKLYIENVYTNEKSIQHIVTTSTLLEGVNIPAQKLFMLDVMKGRGNLTKSQFRNLVGRTCRFKEIFDSDNSDFEMLVPETYILGTEEYMRSNADLKKFLKNHAQVDLSIKDEVENVLLENSDISGESIELKREADEYLENLAQGITGENVSYAETEIGKLCFLNNVTEIDILRYEEKMSNEVDKIAQGGLKEARETLDAISEIFIPYLKDLNEFEAYRRLKEESAKKFYTMFLDWRMRNASYAEMINAFRRYWDNPENSMAYVGRWGDLKREESWRESWTDIRTKNSKERTNLAIVRIKEEQDFLDNFILKFVEILNDS